MTTSDVLTRLFPQRDFYYTVTSILFLFVIGIILYVKMVNLGKQAEPCNNQTVTNLIIATKWFSMFLIVLPIIFMFINYTNISVSVFDDIIKIQILLVLFSLITMSLIVSIHFNLKKCNNVSIDNITWGTSILFVLGSCLILVIRYVKDKQDTEIQHENGFFGFLNTFASGYTKNKPKKAPKDAGVSYYAGKATGDLLSSFGNAGMATGYAVKNVVGAGSAAVYGSVNLGKSAVTGGIGALKSGASYITRQFSRTQPEEPIQNPYREIPPEQKLGYNRNPYDTYKDDRGSVNLTTDKKSANFGKVYYSKEMDDEYYKPSPSDYNYKPSPANYNTSLFPPLTM